MAKKMWLSGLSWTPRTEVLAGELKRCGKYVRNDKIRLDEKKTRRKGGMKEVPENLPSSRVGCPHGFGLRSFARWGRVEFADAGTRAWRRWYVVATAMDVARRAVVRVRHEGVPGG